MKSIDDVIEKLSKRVIKKEEFYSLLEKVDREFCGIDLEIELLISNGLPLVVDETNAYLKTFVQKIKNQVFCVVDIETNGNKADKSQIIEIGAIKIKNGIVIDSYESFAFTKEIPEFISQVTNITPQMTHNSPPLKEVLEEFKIFLEDAVFVAHNANFDYKFISESFKHNNLGKLYNRKLCTIDLAKRVIDAPKYGLESLKQILEINIDNHHRAYSDAKSATEILKFCLNKLPKKVDTVEQLIKFSKSYTN